MRAADGPLRHGVVVAEPAGRLAGHLGFDPTGGVGLADWLAISTQALAEVTAGAVFHDGLGLLGPVRERLAWYPDDVWRYILACQRPRPGGSASATSPPTRPSGPCTTTWASRWTGGFTCWGGWSRRRGSARAGGA
ncbi:DUF4037 domain-containing protein [Microbispora cellulosiformans]|uniref:DUF4037 domain-containing protein n=1 Tax=Microbispora cellulosiformans TaxID=2614688 RepID=A0A5J5JZV5_9ACTN|nr:DUF4037 domain-containing protein [Microbispora cellulosiformans]KAA9376085.1 DUF4037 domain-containing protein [Microbispora cellulosiformans]